MVRSLPGEFVVWCRVFGLSTVALSAIAVQEQLQQLAPQLRCAFQGDERSWFRLELWTSAGTTCAELDHYWATEDGIRPQLNTWAAWLETHEHNPNIVPLMQHIIQTGQLFCLHVPALLPVGLDEFCFRFCRWLAHCSEGVFQADGSGFHAADGTLLVAEEP